MIPLMKNAFIKEYETKKELAKFIMKADRLSMDKECFKFEKSFAEYQERNEAILFNSGASANLAMLQALKNIGKLKENDKIGFSALTWSTNVMPIIQLGFKPIPLDCDVETLNVMTGTLKNLLEQTEIKALFITNVLGLAGDLDNIREICKERKIILLEDNCEALGTELTSGKTGNFGLASSFSFFVAHHMSTIEGGMVCTDDSELTEMLKIVRANGWDRNLNSKQQLLWREKYQVQSDFQAKYTFYDLGFNLRPTEITGFLGQYQMKFLEENVEKREKNYYKMKDIVTRNEELTPLKHPYISRLSSFAFPVIAKSTNIRDKYYNRFIEAEIEIRPIIAGNIQKQPFYSKYVKEKYDLPNSDIIHNNGFYCGNFPELSDSDIEIIINCLANEKK